MQEGDTIRRAFPERPGHPRRFGVQIKRQNRWDLVTSVENFDRTVEHFLLKVTSLLMCLWYYSRCPTEFCDVRPRLLLYHPYTIPLSLLSQVCEAALQALDLRAAARHPKAAVLLTCFANELIRRTDSFPATYELVGGDERKQAAADAVASVVQVFAHRGCAGGVLVFGSGPWPAIRGGEWATLVTKISDEIYAVTK